MSDTLGGDELSAVLSKLALDHVLKAKLVCTPWKEAAVQVLVSSEWQAEQFNLEWLLRAGASAETVQRRLQAEPREIAIPLQDFGVVDITAWDIRAIGLPLPPDWNVFHVAVANRCPPEVLHVLAEARLPSTLEAASPLMAKDQQGCTPLHLAVMLDVVDIICDPPATAALVQMLVQLGPAAVMERVVPHVSLRYCDRLGEQYDEEHSTHRWERLQGGAIASRYPLHLATEAAELMAWREHNLVYNEQLRAGATRSEVDDKICDLACELARRSAHHSATIVNSLLTARPECAIALDDKNRMALHEFFQPRSDTESKVKYDARLREERAGEPVLDSLRSATLGAMGVDAFGNLRPPLRQTARKRGGRAEEKRLAGLRKLEARRDAVRLGGILRSGAVQPAPPIYSDEPFV